MNTLRIRPSAIYALLTVFPLLLVALVFLWLAWWLLPAFILLSMLVCLIALYKYVSVRRIIYELDEEVLHISTGIFFRRTDSLELYRVKDYIVTRNFLLQIFGLMNLTLLTTDLTGPVTMLRGIPRSDLPDLIRERVQRARQNSKIIELN